MSPASFTGMSLLDCERETHCDAVQRAGLSAQTTYIIVSDHGFRTISIKIHPNVMLRDKGLLMGADAS